MLRYTAMNLTEFLSSKGVLLKLLDSELMLSFKQYYSFCTTILQIQASLQGTIMPQLSSKDLLRQRQTISRQISNRDYRLSRLYFTTPLINSSMGLFYRRGKKIQVSSALNWSRSQKSTSISSYQFKFSVTQVSMRQINSFFLAKVILMQALNRISPKNYWTAPLWICFKKLSRDQLSFSRNSLKSSSSLSQSRAFRKLVMKRRFSWLVEAFNESSSFRTQFFPPQLQSKKNLRLGLRIQKSSQRVLEWVRAVSGEAAMQSIEESSSELLTSLQGVLLALECGEGVVNKLEEEGLLEDHLNGPVTYLLQECILIHYNFIASPASAIIPMLDFIQSFRHRKFRISHSASLPLLAFCPCQLCLLHSPSPQLQVFPRPSSDFKAVLRNICNPRHREISGAVGVRVSQTCFYQKGEPICIYGNRKGLSIKEIRKGINNTLINKVFNENRRLYREKLKLKQPSKDAVIIHFSDQYPQVFTEIQFLNLLNKRKSDPFWSTVEKISNFTWTPSIQSNRHFFYFFEGKVKGPLFQAAKNYIQSICGHFNASYDDFVSNQQQAKLVKSLSKTDRLQYCSYKIVHFMEIIHQTDVRKLVLDLSINENDEVVLIDAFQFDGTQYPPLEWNEQIYKKRLQNQANQILEMREEHRAVSLKQEKVHRIQGQMYQHFTGLKFKFGLIEQQPKSQFAQSDYAFNKLRPRAPPLSLLIKQGITLQSFKKSFYPCRTKPQFNLMTTVLHKLTSHSRQRKGESKQTPKSAGQQRTGLKRLSVSVRL